MAKAERHNVKRPIKWWASELGIDRHALTKNLEAKGFDCSEGATGREIWEAEFDKLEAARNRARKNKFEADKAELDFAERKKELMLTKDHIKILADFGTKTRRAIDSADYIPKPAQIRLLKELAAIRSDE
jgi:hypothetical protein